MSDPADADQLNASERKQLNQDKRKFFGMDKKLRGITRALAHSQGITVEYGGLRAFTEGRTVHLPFLKSDLSNEDINAHIGYVQHEAGHVRYTDFDGKGGFKDTIKTLTNKYTKNLDYKMTMYITNFVEDIRIESCIMADQKGSKGHIDCMNKSILDEMKNMYRMRPTPEGAVTDALLHHCYTYAGGNAKHEVWDNMKQNEHFQKISGMLKPVVALIQKDCQDKDKLKPYTQECMKRIALFLRKKEKEDQCPSQPEQGGDNEEDSISNPTASQISDAISQLRQAIEDEQTSAQRGYASGEITSAGDRGKAKLLKNDSAGVDVSKEGSNGLSQYSLRDTFMQTRILPSTKDGAIAASSRLRKDFVRAFRGHVLKYTRRFQSTGIIDMRSVPGYYAMGRVDIFKNTKKHVRVNSAVHLTVDASGSMGNGNVKGDKAEIARKIFLAINYAIKGLNIRLSSSVFSHDYALLKKNTQKLEDSMVKYITGSGGTNLGKAVMSSGYYLAGATEERKIILCLTDGHASYDVHEADKIITRGGIEVYYIIIAKDEGTAKAMVRRAPLEHRRCIPFWGDFTGQFLSMFKDLLLNGKR